MLALVKTAPGPGLSLETVPEPAFGINDVVIRVRKTGICGTDIHIWKWDDWAQKTIPVPMQVGHEYVGEIVEVGPEVDGQVRVLQGLKAGDKIVTDGALFLKEELDSR